MTDKTDWDRYYLTSPPLITRLARAVTGQVLLRAFREIKQNNSEISICELGGANSCFARNICEQIAVKQYHIVDSNALGLSLIDSIHFKTGFTTELCDILNPYSNNMQFDIVYSVGLIEHFHSIDTEKALEAHFARCKKHGHVLVTFPTPTWLYRFCRTSLEKIGRWDFPDERPLNLNETKKLAKKYGVIRSESITWLIGLTQGLLLIEKTY